MNVRVRSNILKRGYEARGDFGSSYFTETGNKTRNKRYESLQLIAAECGDPEGTMPKNLASGLCGGVAELCGGEMQKSVYGVKRAGTYCSICPSLERKPTDKC